MMRLLASTSKTTITEVTTAPTTMLSADPAPAALATRPPTTPARAALPPRRPWTAREHAVEPGLGAWAVRLVEASLIVVVARDGIRLELRCDLEIRVTETIHAGHEPEVLDPGVDDADGCGHTDEEAMGRTRSANR